ncbi:hypothetical protein CKO36_06410 [Rhabdochromatium marinum]|nr:glycosyltransferase family 2 protein [Rhabdochromatium marinum]MBK1648243.1 hypothetical protein [Rhabdochromatium marinum]
MVSVVVYDSSESDLRSMLASLAKAAEAAVQARLLSEICLFLVDNSRSTPVTGMLERLRREWSAPLTAHTELRVEVLSGHGNLGYGRGNNRALKQAAAACYCLILNPDVELEPNVLVEGIGYLRSHPAVAMVAPAVIEADGRLTHLCKAYPTVFDLWLRGFAPSMLKRWFHQRLERYTLEFLWGSEVPADIPIASGSFMLCQGAALRQVGGFDPGYFLYFEDFDLSLRIATQGAVRWLPAMRIRHAGGQAARKGVWHVWQFTRSGVRFFNQHGWHWM